MLVTLAGMKILDRELQFMYLQLIVYQYVLV